MIRYCFYGLALYLLYLFSLYMYVSGDTSFMERIAGCSLIAFPIWAMTLIFIYVALSTGDGRE